MAIRNVLHMNKLDDFRGWLINDGWNIENTKGYYEVLRATKNKRKLILYKKIDAKEHISIQDKDMGVVGAFLKDSSNNR